MRCRYCDKMMDEWEYGYSPQYREFIEGGRHKNGRCVGGPVHDEDTDAFEDLPFIPGELSEEVDDVMDT